MAREPLMKDPASGIVHEEIHSGETVIKMCCNNCKLSGGCAIHTGVVNQFGGMNLYEFYCGKHEFNAVPKKAELPHKMDLYDNAYNGATAFERHALEHINQLIDWAHAHDRKGK